MVSRPRRTYRSWYTLLRSSLTAIANDIQSFSAFDELMLPASFYPRDPLDPEQAQKITPYFVPDLNKVAQQVNQGQTTSTFIAPRAFEPFNLVPRRYSAPPLDSRDGYTSLDHEIDPFLAAFPNLDLSFHYPQDGGLTPAQVDESVHRSFAPYAPWPLYDVGTIGTSPLADASLNPSTSHVQHEIPPQAQMDENVHLFFGPSILSKRRSSLCLSTVTGYSASSGARSSIRSFLISSSLKEIRLSWFSGSSTHSSNKSHKCASVISSEMPAPMLGFNDEELRNSRRSGIGRQAVDAAGAATTVRQKLPCSRS
jgi:hypothetical protein